MIKLFTLRQPIVFLFLVVLVFLMRLPVLLSSVTYPLDLSAYTFFGEFFVFLNQNKMSSYITGSIIILLQTLHLNYLFEKHNVHYKITFLPALFYIIYASLFNVLDANITPALLAQTPLMMVLEIYFDLYKSPNVGTKIFTAMFVLGLGTLVYLPMAFFLPVFLINIFFFKIPSPRDYLVAIAGAVLPIYFAFVYLYFNGQYDFFMTKVNLLTKFKSTIVFEQSAAQLALFIIFGLIILSTSFKLYTNHFKNIIKTRIIQQMLFVLSFVVLFILAFLLQFHNEHLLLFILPFSYLLSYFFMGKWRFFLNEIIATSILIFIFVIKLYHL